MRLRLSLERKVTFDLSLSEKIEDHFDPPDESDYIYDGDTILFYIGASTRPSIPATLGGNQVRVIERTAFGGTEVEAVKIPEGVTTIE